MDQEPDVIREHIEETRSALTEKLETLENEVRGTVESAKSTAMETIENVKTAVQDTVDSVKRTFDLEYQVDQRPWVMIGGSVVAGYLAGSYLRSKRHAPPLPSAPAPSSPAFYPGANPRPALASESVQVTSSNGRQQTERPSWLNQFLQQFDSEIQQVKEIAIGAAMGLARDLIKEAVPQFGQQVEHLMDSATTKLGGKPVPRSYRSPTEHSVGGMHSASSTC